MKAFIDRIEDGKTAVVLVEKAGEILVPAVADPELNALKTLTVIEPKRKRY